MRRNQILLMAGALAYNALLSIVPFFALMLLALSHFVDQEGLLRALSGTVELVTSFGVEVVSSADLVQTFEAVLDDVAASDIPIVRVFNKIDLVERPVTVDRNADGAVIRVSADGRLDRVLWRDDGTGLHVEEAAP